MERNQGKEEGNQGRMKEIKGTMEGNQGKDERKSAEARKEIREG